MKNISIAGNIGKDAETRTTQTGDKVTKWSVAVEERNGGEKRSIWFECTMWGKRGESIAPYLTKGGKVAVSGDFSTREHDGKTYLTVRAEQVTLMGGGQDRGGSQGRSDGGQGYREGTGTRGGGYGAGLDDEIPFAPQVL